MNFCDQTRGTYWRFQSRRARANGRYTPETLRLYWYVWRLSQQADDLLAFLLFRRDLGFRLTRSWATKLSANYAHLSASRKILAYSLLFEFHQVCPSEQKLLLADPSRVQLPAVLHCLSETYVLSGRQLLLKQVFERQVAWQKAFQAELLEWIQGKGVCVVGNAAGMTGSGLGFLIDQYDCVVRFNIFSGKSVVAEDTGNKIDVWCVTPSYKGKNKPSVRWSVLLGPELQYRTMNWSNFSSLLEGDGHILTLPASVWSELVGELGAPPSAGIAFLAYIKHLSGSFEGISAAGFSGLFPQDIAGAAYHHTNSWHKASRRHNWAGERALIQLWLTQGLNSLHGY